MALSAAANTLNTAVDTLMAAWEVYCDTLTANDKVAIAFIESNRGSQAANTKYGTDASDTSKYRGGVLHYFEYNPDITDYHPLQVGGKPLFWKISNVAGDLTS